MKKPSVLIEHILESINYIQTFTEGVSYDEFAENIEKQDAVQRRFEIIGEAVKNLPEDLKLSNHKIPWRSVASMRDLIIHEYFSVSLELLWETIHNELPKFKNEILELARHL